MVADRMTNVDEDTPFKGKNLLEASPPAFALLCLLVFAPPAVKCFTLAFDMNVTHWIGNAPRVFAFLPLFLIVIAYLILLHRRVPSKWAFVLGLIGCSVVFAIFAYSISGTALSLSGMFSSTDCSTFQQKWNLERSWQAARDFYADCATSGAATGVPAYPIEDCPGYTENLVSNPDWIYLGRLEDQYACGGWCEASQQLWTSFQVADPCSVAVAEVMRSKVQRLSTQVLVYDVAILGLASSVLIFIGGSAARTRSLDW